tara:strand:- start:107711 stop:109831 length:2121 start_codon:yes stop_codon:yes gene_type:complete
VKIRSCTRNCNSGLFLKADVDPLQATVCLFSDGKAIKQKSQETCHLLLYLKLSGVKVFKVIDMNAFSRSFIQGIIFLLLPFGLAAQVTDSLWLDEVQVSSTRIYLSDEYQPVSISRVDSLSINLLTAGTISEALEYLTPVFVRSNGPGGLATISQRGYASSQTQILWNGFPLNHSMLGVTDLSIIPDFAISSIHVASGSGNTGFGDKGGGTIEINTHSTTEKIGLSARVGSFGRTGSEFIAATSHGNWKVSVIAGIRDDENDFMYQGREFSNEAGGFVQVDKYRINNALSSRTAITEVNWASGKKSYTSILWAHDQSNGIPGSVSAINPESYQEDTYLRWMNRYTTVLGAQKLNIRSYINRQDLDFIDPGVNLSSLSTSTQIQTDAELRSSLSRKIQLVSALQAGFSTVEASEYNGNVERFQSSLQSTLIWHPIPRLYTYSSIKGDHYSDFGPAYTYRSALNAELVWNTLFLRSQFSRGFTAPTFNDLYWPALGNPDLTPETNQKFETGLLLKLAGTDLSAETEFTFYADKVHDGIRWLPGNDGRSRPENIEQLSLQGFEFKEQARAKLGDLKLAATWIIQHTLAEISEERFDGDAAVGKQLRYTPEWQLSASLNTSWRFFNTLLTYKYTGERFSSADHSSPFDPMEPYRVLNVSTSVRATIGAFNLSPTIALYNLLNEEYSVIRDYPQPGRNYLIKLTLTYNLKK